MFINKFNINPRETAKASRSTDKQKITTISSKSLSKPFNNMSPNIKSGNKDLAIIKQKIGKTKKKGKKIQQQKQKEKQKEPKVSKKKTNFTINLKQLKPINLQKEKQLFFSNNCKTNPFFLYPNISDINDEQYKQAKKYQPDTQYLDFCIKILEKGRQLNIIDLFNEGIVLNRDQTELAFNSYIDRLEVKDILVYQFLENTVANTSVIHNNTDNMSKVVIGLPIKYTNYSIEGTMNHEIGTHFLRKHNDRSQKWYKDRKKYSLNNHYLTTQEGLAALNQLLPYVMEERVPPLMYRSALLYLSCYLASKTSFCETFELLEKYLPDPNERWKYCVRVKRGVAETSKSGGMYKDQIYFIGSIEILRNRHRLNFINLHCGKINVVDCLRLTQKNQINNTERIKLPIFLQDMKMYMKCLDVIAEWNGV